MKEQILYYLIRSLTFPTSLFPYRTIHRIGRLLGLFAFYLIRDYRKRALSNLALANDLHLQPKEIKKVAIESFQNLAINCLEYPKLAREKDFSRVIQCENPEKANRIYSQGKGIIFFCGHQSNWEVLFLDGNTRMRGIAIGKPIKNKKLYQWVLSIREKNGGKIITPGNALKEGLRNLRKGIFMGIVGDQGMPESDYSFPFLGRRAWTTTAPALLAYKTQSPIIVATTKRVKEGYRIHYSDPIWPDPGTCLEKEVPRLMEYSLTLLQQSIQNSPGEWLWQHNRWKQQTPHNLFKRFRKDCICIILPKEEDLFHLIYPHLTTLKEIYSKDFLFLIVPEKFAEKKWFATDGILTYSEYPETLLEDYRFKLVFNFTPFSSIKKHYLRLSAFEVLSLEQLSLLAKSLSLKKHSLSDVFKRALCRPGTTWKKEEFIT